jgi:hypothetical protein
MTDNVTAQNVWTMSISATTQLLLASKSSSSGHSVFNILAIIISIIGIVANGFLTFIMAKSNRSTANTTNVLIGNQCLLDTFYSVSSLFNYIFKLANPTHYSQPPTTLDTIVCVLHDSGTISAVFQINSTAGLVAITLERYLKVVHPIGHRKYYRTWMTRVAIVVTWLIGLVTFMLPSFFTTRILYGVCYLTAVWPDVTASKVWRCMSLHNLHHVTVNEFQSCSSSLASTIYWSERAFKFFGFGVNCRIRKLQ